MYISDYPGWIQSPILAIVDPFDEKENISLWNFILFLSKIKIKKRRPKAPGSFIPMVSIY